MNISSLHPKLDASEVPMEQIAGNKALTEDQKIGEATRQFEAVLLRQILESTQKTVIKSKYSEDSATTDIYRDMITNQLADSISKSGGLGLGDTLKREFTRQLHAASGKDEPATTNISAATAETKPLVQSAKHLNHFSNPTHPLEKTQS
jgi:flagellar protein FlgJ